MNKSTILYALAFLLASCQVVTFEEEGNGTGSANGEKTMHFRLTAYSMNNLDEIPNGDEDEYDDEDYDDEDYYDEGNGSYAPTRAASKDATDHLLLAIYDSQGHLVDTIVYQDKDDATLTSYGTFTHTLKYGKYTLLALGWNGSQKCTVHHPDSISFSEDWTPHTFLCRQNISVSAAYSDTRTLSLRRCVAKFSLVFKDYTDKVIPEELSDFVLSISGGGCTLDSETRHCARKKDVTRTIAVTTPSNVRSLVSYSFLPADSAGLTINILARDAAGNTLAEQTFEDVPMKINYETKYSGNFFPFSSTEGAVEFDNNFDGVFEVEF